MSELNDMITEYMQNSESLIEGLQKEASEAHESARNVQQELAEVKASKQLQKEAAIETAAVLIGRGLMSSDNLSQKIDRLCADPLGVIMQMTKTAAEQRPVVPSMGAGCKKSGVGGISTENLSNADKALLTKLRLI